MIGVNGFSSGIPKEEAVLPLWSPEKGKCFIVLSHFNPFSGA